MDEIINKTFYEHFKGYSPSEPLDIDKMSNEERQGYYLKARDLLANPIFGHEISEAKRKLYMELALRSNSELERQGYRMTLIALQSFEDRLKKLAGMYAQKPLRDLQSKL